MTSRTATNLRSTVQNIRDVSDKIASGKGTLGRLINDDSLYQSAQGDPGRRPIGRWTASTIPGPISAVGVLANSLF